MPQDPKTWWKDFSGLRLTKQTQSKLAPTDTYSKSETINHLERIQDQVISKAKQGGNREEIKKAEAFASRLNKEQNFHRYSK